jgi:hypothetical protein
VCHIALKETSSNAGQWKKPSILNDGGVGVVVHDHLKHNHESITNLKCITSEKQLQNLELTEQQ